VTAALSPALPPLPPRGTFDATPTLTVAQAQQALEDVLTEIRRLDPIGLPPPGTFNANSSITIVAYNVAVEDMRTVARRAGARVPDVPFVGRHPSWWIFGVDLEHTRKEREQLEELLVALHELRR